MPGPKMVYVLRGRQRQLARKADHVLGQLLSDELRHPTVSVITGGDYTTHAAPLRQVIAAQLAAKKPR